MPPSNQYPLRHQLRPTLRAPPRQPADDDDERPIQQAGRSSSSLNAHASSQSLQQASRPVSRDWSKSSAQLVPLLGGHGTAASSRSASAHPPGHSRSPSPSPAPAPATALASSSDSHSSTSSSHESRKLSDDAAVEELPISSSSTTAPAPVPRPVPRRQDMAQSGSSTSLSRLSTPRSVRELGSDYSRYYNPFATRNNSQQDVSTRFNSTTHLPVYNPFADRRPASSMFEMPRDSSPDTPKEEEISDVKEVPEMQQVDDAMSEKPKPDHGAVINEKAPLVAATTLTPARAATPVFIHDADPEKTPFFPYMDDRFGAPYAFPLFVDQEEEDDDMHMPRWDDDARYNITLKDHFTRRNLVNTLGMMFLCMGLICVFIVLPIVSYTGTSLIPYPHETPLDEMPGYVAPEPWAWVNNRKYPLLSNLRTGLIDPDTPESAKTRTSRTGQTLELVFSDEFNEKNRTFYPGDDPYWYAPNFWYGATEDLEWYDPDACNTGDGTLLLQLDKFASHGLDYRSGMLHSWNQMCFKGGVFEVSLSLPGPAGVHAWWPGAWTMGNLGRPGYLATTDGLWPYTYNECDVGITPNQSMNDGTSHLPGQRLPSCTCTGEDHPTPGTGRGAPEIDIAEFSADWSGNQIGVATQSFQVAPFDIWYYPNYDFMELPNYNVSFVNTYTGGPFQQAVSTTSMLNNGWYDGNEYQTYAFEYTPGSTEDAGITWYVGDETMMHFDARAIGPNGNVGQRLVSEEPMSMVLNLGFSENWVDINWTALEFPAVMRIDYVRIYQDPDNKTVTCDPPGYETTDYIANHPEAYNNNNYTHWVDAGYDWPTNSLMSGCTAAD